MAERRIGTRERELAMDALDEHHRAGRLTTAEYTDRSRAAASARLRSELDALFDDLPDPHPRYPGDDAGPSGSGSSGSGSSGSGSSGSGSSGSGSSGTAPGPDPASAPELPELVLPTGAALARHVGKLAVFTPVIAFGLFALTGFRFGIIFLLVPVAFMVLGWVGHRHGG